MIIPKEKLKIVFFDYNAVSTIPTLATFVRVEDPDYVALKDCRNYSFREVADEITGIYLGKVEDITKTVNSRKYTMSANTKSLYFSPLSNYPRTKLSENSKIKRKLDPSKADACVIDTINPHIKYHNFGPEINTWARGSVHRWTKQHILYSQSEDMYYFVFNNDKFEPRSGTILYHTWNTYLRTVKYSAASVTYDQIIDLIVNSGLCGSDCTKIYHENVTALSEKMYNFVEILEKNPNMQIIYDTELDAFISNVLKVMDDEDIKTLTSMLNSTDESTVGLGLKLLATYNIKERICTTGSLIQAAWRRIKYNNVSKSTAFKNILQQLGLDRNDFSEYGDGTALINKLYAASQNEDDRNACRLVILAKVRNEIEARIEAVKDTYSSFGIQVTFEVK